MIPYLLLFGGLDLMKWTTIHLYAILSFIIYNREA